MKEQSAFIRRKDLYVPSENEFLLNHSRSGLIIALESMNIPSEGKVGVMAYNCHTVMGAVIQSGYQITFIDITDDLTLDLEDLRRKRGELSALIVTHLFGIRNDVSLIKAEFPDLPIIEDCAHLYGIDSLGDFATFSIGQGKFPSVGDGGVLVVNNEKYKADVNEYYSSLASYGFLDDVKLFCRLLIKSFLYKSNIYKSLIWPLRSKYSSEAIMKKCKVCKMSDGIRAMFTLSLKRLKEEKDKQIANAELMKMSFGLDSAFYGENAFMMIVPSESPKSLQEYLCKRGIASATHFAHCITWAKSVGYHPGSCPKTEELVERLTMIPTYKGIER